MWISTCCYNEYVMSSHLEENFAPDLVWDKLTLFSKRWLLRDNFKWCNCFNLIKSWGDCLFVVKFGEMNPEETCFVLMHKKITDTSASRRCFRTLIIRSKWAEKVYLKLKVWLLFPKCFLDFFFDTTYPILKSM